MCSGHKKQSSTSECLCSCGNKKYTDRLLGAAADGSIVSLRDDNDKFVIINIIIKNGNSDYFNNNNNIVW